MFPTKLGISCNNIMNWNLSWLISIFREKEVLAMPVSICRACHHWQPTIQITKLLFQCPWVGWIVVGKTKQEKAGENEKTGGTRGDDSITHSTKHGQSNRQDERQYITIFTAIGKSYDLMICRLTPSGTVHLTMSHCYLVSKSGSGKPAVPMTMSSLWQGVMMILTPLIAL